MAKKNTVADATEEQNNTDIGIVSSHPGEDITPEDSIVPVYLVPLTAEEEEERVVWAQEQADRELAEQAKADHRKSALAKLAKLGLTEEEISAL